MQTKHLFFSHLVKNVCEPKVNELGDLLLSVEDDVGRLDVAVRNAVLVEVVDAGNDLPEKEDRLGLRNVSATLRVS